MKGKGDQAALHVEDEKAEGGKDASLQEDTDLPSSGILEGCLYTFEYKAPNGRMVKRTVKWGKVLFRPHGILGRGTIVVEVTCVCSSDYCHGHCDWKDLRLVMKLSFASRTRRSEVDFIDHCISLAKSDPKHAWVLKHLPEVHASFVLPFGPGTVQHRLKEYFSDSTVYEERELRGSIKSKLDNLMTLQTVREFGQAIYDVLQCALYFLLVSILCLTRYYPLRSRMGIQISSHSPSRY